jgi:hypothetical protein
VHQPTGQDIEVKSASLTMPYLGCARTQFIQGNPSIRLEDYKDGAPFSVDDATIKDGTLDSFALPAAQGDCTPREIAGGGPAGHGCVDRRKFTFRLRHRRGQRVISVRAYVNGKRVLKRRGHNVRFITIKKLPLGKFRVKIVKITNDRHKTTTVRVYKGCRKGRPHGSHSHV